MKNESVLDYASRSWALNVSHFLSVPMALRAWLSSKLKALIGTSSQTGSTATVERLLAGLVTSGLDAMLGRPKAEPRERKEERSHNLVKLTGLILKSC